MAILFIFALIGTFEIFQTKKHWIRYQSYAPRMDSILGPDLVEGRGRHCTLGRGSEREKPGVREATGAKNKPFHFPVVSRSPRGLALPDIEVYYVVRAKPACWISTGPTAAKTALINRCTNGSLVYDKDSGSNQGERESMNKHTIWDNWLAGEDKMSLMSASHHPRMTHSKLIKIQETSFKHQSLKLLCDKRSHKQIWRQARGYLQDVYQRINRQII